MRAIVRRVRDWLYRPVGRTPGAEQLAELTRYPLRIDAENAVRTLELNGIEAVMFAGDDDGWSPHLGAVQGNRVMVRVGDLERAARALTDHS